ncbi:hypothetical protein DVT68_06660 [Dyella solisilvae]|uniref:Sel1 repeat family protein n=1 Tax=Dyella solisilvae TaxID=1920168 RepID=A0A370KEE1_9GAMM|nr:hypothetical protein DVT68_06660 [Dyella solisilvae]
MFDPAIPLPERSSALADIERDAGAASGDELYLLGTLYHMGRHAPNSPVDADDARAATYFANAAVRGNVLGMAKMAELKIETGDFREAMNWAEIYAHYAPIAGRQGSADQAYSGDLAQRIQQNVDASSMDAIMKDVNSFVFVNDKAIREGMANSGLDEPDLHPNSNRRHYTPTTTDGQLSTASIGDFLVGFDSSGQAASVQLLDVAPHRSDADAMRSFVASMKVEPASGGDAQALRYLWIPIVMGGQRYRTHDLP